MHKIRVYVSVVLTLAVFGGCAQATTAQAVLPSSPTSALSPSSTVTGSIPALSQWEANMLSYGKTICEMQKSGKGQAGNVLTLADLQESIYYDAIQVYLQMYQYTKDAFWKTCAAAAVSIYRDKYSIAQNGAVPGYWNFTNGLVLDYQINGDIVSKAAAIQLSQNAMYARDTPLEWTASPVSSREVAYAVRSYLNAEKLGEPRRARLKDLVAQMYGHIDQWFISKTYRYPGGEADDPRKGRYHIQPFMVGLTMEALIMWYDATTDPAEHDKVKANVKVCLDWLWANAWVTADQAFWYENWVSDPATPFPSSKGAPDLNMLIAPAYAWYYQMTGDSVYRNRGDQVFAGGVKGAYLSGGKQFNQHYSYGFYYVSRRQGQIGAPKPTPHLAPRAPASQPTGPSITLNGGTGGITAKAGDVVVVAVNGPGTPGDCVGLYPTGADIGAPYLKVAPVQGSSVVVPFAMPAAPGTYEFRFFQNCLNAKKLAVSAVVTVTAP